MGETSTWEEAESWSSRERLGMGLGQARSSPWVSSPTSQLVLDGRARSCTQGLT